ncbi:MAG TPA: alpha-glucan family phosphorylase [Thermoanaerobaculia bacterium]|jgi:starch phosphorylase
MRPLGTYRAAPALPPALAPLADLARDMRWTWRPATRTLFRELDPEEWRRSGNPVLLLRSVDPARLAALAVNADYVARVHAAAAAFAAEDAATPAVPGIADLAAAGVRVAYFCAEFGLSEMLPIYSGGLGVLAGDHLKSSSDLGVPLVGVGIFYREGFFRQTLTADARQKESYPIVDPLDLPVEVLPTPAGVAPVVTVSVGDRDVHLLIRRVRVGRTPLLLLDAHLPANRPADREITNRLYGGDTDMRIRQEIVLGIGGMRALEVAGLRPTVRHANEGHAAFLGLERIRQLRAERGLSFAEAREIATAGNVFTTHTPVPAGIDLFPRDLMQRTFEKKLEGYGIGLDELLGLGRQVPEDPNEYFSMAVLGLRLSSRVNAVSRLHAKVSRRLWRGVFPDAPLSEIPIGAVTNGVHGPSWTSKEIAGLNPRDGDGPDPAELWRRHEHRRAALVETVRIRSAAARTRRGAPDVEVAAAWQLLDPTAFTIGFARRFATYKRATLIFQDPARLSRLLSDPNRPVQIVFAGKAHPRDHAGKEFLRRVGEFAAQPEFLGRVVLVEDYDMRLARRLVQGVDVWLNNPRRPFEASGTSGMKAAMNGVLNLSVLDGWWDEAPRDGAGFTIGDATEGRPDDEMANSLYERLESEIVPLFYDRPNGDRSGVPAGWAARMATSAHRLGRLFHSDRMVGEYVSLAYTPAANRVASLSADADAKAKELAAWKEKVRSAWDEVGFVSVTTAPEEPARVEPGESFTVEVQIRLGGLEPADLVVDWFEGEPDHDGVVDAGFSTPLVFQGRLDGTATWTGSVGRPAEDNRGYSVRVRPSHPLLVHPNETNLVLWAE